MLLNIDRSKNLQTITWGLESSINDVGSDAYVAKQLAKKVNLPHKYYHTDFSEEPIQTIFERYLKIGEGRTDNIGGYLDGFNIWNVLYNEGYLGIIRGDEGFGWEPTKTAEEARVKNGVWFLEDYNNLKPYLEGLPEVELASELVKGENESVATWRDRLFQEFYTPVVLSALNDLKLSHVEIVNPLLSREIISTIRTIPDKLRTEKKLFKDIVDSFEIGIPYANHGSNMEIKSIFKEKKVVDEIKQVLSSSDILPKDLISYIMDNMTVASSGTKTFSLKEKVMRSVKANLPDSIKDILKRNIPTNIDVNMLGFRAYMIVEMDRILNEDTKLLKSAELK